MDGTGPKAQWSCVIMEIQIHSPSACAGTTLRPRLLLQGSMSWIGMKAMKKRHFRMILKIILKNKASSTKLQAPSG